MKRGAWISVAVLLAAQAASAKPVPPKRLHAPSNLFSKVDVRGALDKGGVKAELRAREPKVRGCVAGGANWSFELSFSVMATGEVVGLRVLVKDAKRQACLEKAFAKMRFPAADRTTTVESNWRSPQLTSLLGVLSTTGGAVVSIGCKDGLCIEWDGKPDAADRKRFEGAIAGHRRAVSRCLLSKSKYYVELRVRRSGYIDLMRARPTNASSTLNRCLGSALKSVRMPRASRGRTLRMRLRRLASGYGYGFSSGIGGSVGGLGTKGLGTRGRHGGLVGVGVGSGAGYGRGAKVRGKCRVSKIRPGNIDKYAFRRVVMRGRARLNYCYEKALQKRPALRGKLEVELEVRANGSVKSAKASGLDPKVDLCVSRQVRRMRFPKNPKGSDASFDIIFASF